MKSSLPLSVSCLSTFPELREQFVSLALSKAREYGIPVDNGQLRVRGLDSWLKCHVKQVPSTCCFPLLWLDVLSNGQARFCCYGLRILGNILDSTIEEIWNGVLAQEARTLLSQDNIPEVCSGAGCPYVQGRKAERAAGPETTPFKK